MYKNLINVLLFVISFFFLAVSSVSASTMYLTPASGTVEIGKNYYVTINLNTTGEAVNAVTSYLSYPEDKLDIVSVTPTTTFNIEAENTFGSGTIKISRGSLTPISGMVTLATITFKGKAAGIATINFNEGSAAPSANSSQETLTFKSVGVYTITNTPTPTPSPIITPTPSASVSPTPSATVTPLTSATPEPSVVGKGLENIDSLPKTGPLALGGLLVALAPLGWKVRKFRSAVSNKFTPVNTWVKRQLEK